MSDSDNGERNRDTTFGALTLLLSQNKSSSAILINNNNSYSHAINVYVLLFSFLHFCARFRSSESIGTNINVMHIITHTRCVFRYVHECVCVLMRIYSESRWKTQLCLVCAKR